MIYLDRATLCFFLFCLMGTGITFRSSRARFSINQFGGGARDGFTSDSAILKVNTAQLLEFRFILVWSYHKTSKTATNAGWKSGKTFLITL